MRQLHPDPQRHLPQSATPAARRAGVAKDPMMLELFLKYLSWPVAIVAIALASVLFLRKALSDVVRRGGLRISKEGLSIDQATAAAIADQSEAVSEGNVLKLDPEAERRLLQVKQVSISVTIRNQQQRIRDELIKLSLINDKDEAIDVLVQHLAVSQLFHAAERLYRLIFGSQISILRYLNLYGASDIAAIQKFYEMAKIKYPELYEKYSFDAYLTFLRSSELITTTDNYSYAITLLGKDFLQWMALEAVSDAKLLARRMG